MRSIQIESFGGPLVAQKRQRPTPSSGEILLWEMRCGTCHTDLHLWQDYYDPGDNDRLPLKESGIAIPIIPEHDIHGEIVEGGPNGGKTALGKTDVFCPWFSCSGCPNCNRGFHQHCLEPKYCGVRAPDCYYEYIKFPDARYAFDTGNIDPGVAATFACSGLTSFSALKKISNVNSTDWIGLIGAGGVSLAGLHFAKALGIHNVAVFHLSEEIPEAALSACASIVIDPNDPESIASALENLKCGFYGILGFVRNTSSFEMGLLRNGGHLALVGLFGGNSNLQLPPMHLRAITVHGSYVGNCDEISEMIDIQRTAAIAPIPHTGCSYDQVNTIQCSARRQDQRQGHYQAGPELNYGGVTKICLNN